MQSFGHNRYGPKIGGSVGLCPFGDGELGPIYHNVARAEAYMRAKFHLGLSSRLSTVHQRYRQTDKQTDNQDRQTDRQTDNGPIA